VFPNTKEQRCWFLVLSNVLAALPKSAHPGAKPALAEIYNAEEKDHAVRAAKAFEADYGAKWPKATAKITEHLDVLLAFYDYPAEHWIHLRTTNPIESTFATVRLRQRVTKGPGSRTAGAAMAFKLLESAQARWRAVNAPTWSPSSVPARCSRRASSSNDPTNQPRNQEVINKSRDTPIHGP
jgi:putative transposase